jgi:hypothetical protein
MIRFLSLAATLLFATDAAAQMPHPLSQTTHCEGKYTQAAAAIDAAHDLYGTVYSGGNHFRSLNTGLKKTIDLYRLMKGFAPLEIKGDQKHYNFDLSKLKPTASHLTKALRLMTWSDPEMSEKEMRDYLIFLDLLTSLGPADDWWLRAEDYNISEANRGRYFLDRMPREEAVEYARTHITPAQRIVADFTTRHDELDWLQSALILSASPHPWGGSTRQTASPERANLLGHIETKALGGDSNRAWLALLSHHQFYERAVPTSINNIQRKIAADIENCSASPALYAALVSGNYLVSDAAMPHQHFELNLQIQARKLTVESQNDPLGGGYYAQISALRDRSRQKEKFVLPLIYAAPNLQTLEEAMHPKSRVTRPLLVLSGRDLENIAPAAAFTRHVTMDRPADAKRVLDKVLFKRPELKSSLVDILDSDLPMDIQMALVVLRQKCLSHLISKFCTAEQLSTLSHLHRDINQSYSNGEFLQREFESWLYPDSANYDFSDTNNGYYRQHQIGSERYHPIHNRRRSTTRAGARPSKSSKNRYMAAKPNYKYNVIASLTDSAVPKTGLMALADWEEFRAITGEQRLTRAISLDIIDWARNARADSFMAESLHRVVRLNKHEDGGDVDGQPLGKVAFEILHQNFPNSNWTKRTPYWW